MNLANALCRYRILPPKSPYFLSPLLLYFNPERGAAPDRKGGSYAYIVLANYTQQGIQNIKESPARFDKVIDDQQVPPNLLVVHKGPYTVSGVYYG